MSSDLHPPWSCGVRVVHPNIIIFINNMKFNKEQAVSISKTVFFLQVDDQARCCKTWTATGVGIQWIYKVTNCLKYFKNGKV